MSVYVDRFPPVRKYGVTFVAHMIADTHAELETMARALRMSRSWIQKPGTYAEHYDLNEYKRSMAIRFGAIEVTTRELVMIEQRKREETQ
jgi:hypothetical protein